MSQRLTPYSRPLLSVSQSIATALSLYISFTPGLVIVYCLFFLKRSLHFISDHVVDKTKK